MIVSINSRQKPDHKAKSKKIPVNILEVPNISPILGNLIQMIDSVRSVLVKSEYGSFESNLVAGPNHRKTLKNGLEAIFLANCAKLGQNDFPKDISVRFKNGSCWAKEKKK